MYYIINRGRNGDILIYHNSDITDAIIFYCRNTGKNYKQVIRDVDYSGYTSHSNLYLVTDDKKIINFNKSIIPDLLEFAKKEYRNQIINNIIK